MSNTSLLFIGKPVTLMGDLSSRDFGMSDVDMVTTLTTEIYLQVQIHQY